MNKQIIILLCSLFLLIPTVMAIEIKDVTINLSDDNSGEITMQYQLSDREMNFLKSDKEEVNQFASTFFGLNEDGSGLYSSREENMTQWAEMNGSRVLLLHGFYFDEYDLTKDKSLLNISPNIAFFTPDYMPAKVSITWPDGKMVQVENKTYIPNLMYTMD